MKQKTGEITRECSIGSSSRTDQIHHQIQIPSWVSKLIKTPEKPVRKFSSLMSQSAKPSKWFRAKQGFRSGILLQSESNGFKALLFKDFSMTALVRIKEVVFVVIDLLSLESYAISEI
jgi:hypothetical protein